MKAVRLLEYGGQLVFNDYRRRRSHVTRFLVKIKSTTVNHVDLEASGASRQILPIDLPWIPGHGVFRNRRQIGSDVCGYAPGDAVFGPAAARTRSTWRSSRQPLSENHPTSTF